jgi:predicted permease
MRSRRPVPRVEALLDLVLRAYPRRFAAQREEMRAWLREHRDATSRKGGVKAWIGFWWLLVNDCVRAHMATKEAAAFTVRLGLRHGRGGPPLDGFVADARVAWRSLLRQPAFLLLAVGTLGMGVGSATTIYSAVYAILLAPLPYAEPGRIVRVGKISDGRAGILSMSALDLSDIQARNRSFEALAASRLTSMTIVDEGEPELLRVAMVSSELFQVLGASPPLGRAWSPEVDLPGGEAVAVLGHEVWQRRWGGAPEVIGRSVTLSGTPFTVVGVMPASFVPPEALGQRGVEVWIPLAFVDAESRRQRGSGFLQVLGRLHDDVTLEAAALELRELGASISRDFPEPGERTFGLSPLHAETIGPVGDRLIPLLGAVWLLLLIACVNVANLMLVRGSEREREMALRRVIGAGRARLVRQLLTESALLGVLGGVIGAAAASVGVHLFAAIAPADTPRLDEVVVDADVLWRSMVLSMLTTLLVGLLPALRQSVPRKGLAGRGDGRRVGAMRLQNVLVVAEVSLSLVLVVAGGLLLGSFVRLHEVETGFEVDDAYVIAVSYPPDASADEVNAFFDDVLERFAGLPGVGAVGATVNLPLSGNTQMRRVQISDMAMSAEDREQGGYPVNYQQVTPDYFRAIGIEMRGGRPFQRTDVAAAPPVAIVNEALARVLVGGGEVLGRTFTFADDSAGARPHEIVGVVADARQQTLANPGEPELYLSTYQHPSNRLEIVARAPASQSGPLTAMREQIRAVRPDLPVRRSTAMRDYVSQSIANPRFYSMLIGTSAVLALGLALVGVYGVLAQSVAQRRRELGVRIALGATAASVARSVVGRGMGLAGIGATIGVGGALLATRLLETLLFGITATDPLTFVLAVATILVTAALASAVPAGRAARVDPMVSLKSE